MNNKHKKIIELNFQLSEHLKETIPLVSSSLLKTKFKKSGRALLSFVPKCGFINNSIVECYLTSNPYASGILFRSLVEHSFRHLYIYTRALNEKEDEVGNEYYGKLKGSETLDSMYKINNYNRKVSPNKTSWTFEDKDNKLIRETKKKFDISPIFTYLIDNVTPETHPMRNKMEKYLLRRLDQYTKFSSNVHGGPYAELVHNNLQLDQKVLQSQLHDLTLDSFDLYKSVVETTYVFGSLFNEKIFNYLDKIRIIGRQVKSKG